MYSSGFLRRCSCLLNYLFSILHHQPLLFLPNTFPHTPPQRKPQNSTPQSTPVTNLYFFSLHKLLQNVVSTSCLHFLTSTYSHCTISVIHLLLFHCSCQGHVFTYNSKGNSSFGPFLCLLFNT